MPLPDERRPAVLLDLGRSLGLVVGDIHDGHGLGSGRWLGAPGDGHRGGKEDLAERVDGPGDAVEQDARDVRGEGAAASRPGRGSGKGGRCPADFGYAVLFIQSNPVGLGAVATEIRIQTS